MNFNLTEDRRILSEMLSRYLEEKYETEKRNRVAYKEPFYDPEKWKDLSDLGVLAALASKNAGGFGGAGSDISVIFEAIGKALVCEPILPVLMASRLLNLLGRDQEKLLDGSVRYAVAISEPDAPYDLAQVTSTADKKHRLTGRKSAVYGAHCAQIILVAAKLDSQLNLYQIS